MNEQLIKLLKLPTDSGEKAIVAAVEKLIATSKELQAENEELLTAPAESDTAKFEKRIQKKIAESAGALNREQAVIAINHQDEAIAAAAKAKAKKK